VIDDIPILSEAGVLPQNHEPASLKSGDLNVACSGSAFMRRVFLFLLVSMALTSPLYAQREAQTSRNLTAASGPNACVALEIAGMGAAGVQVNGTYSGTVTWTVSANAGDFVAIDLAPPDDPGSPVNSTTSTGFWKGDVASARQLRACLTAYTSGTATVTLVAAGTGGGAGGGGRVVSTVGTAGTPTATADSATNVTLMAANAARLALRCTNTSTATLYLKFGAIATTSSFSVPIAPGGYYNAEWPVPTTIVDGIWATDPNTGSAICQELTQ
jgi:hypothetical protein